MVCVQFQGRFARCGCYSFWRHGARATRVHGRCRLRDASAGWCPETVIGDGTEAEQKFGGQRNVPLVG